ncbi:MAG: aminopeptidase P family protein [Actinobacteria bacterium]|nr:aminopeptidase P family protein [Actinomycetota bacterium]
MKSTTNTKKYFYLRLKRLKRILEDKNIPCMVILKDENIFYLTGFYGKDSDSLFCIVNGDLYLLVHNIYYEQARNSICLDGVNIIRYSFSKYEELSKLLGNYSLPLVGAESNNISHSDFLTLEDKLKKQNKKLVGVEDIVEDMRMIKDDLEIERIENACKITDSVFSSIINSKLSNIRNLSEIELKLEIEKEIISKGGDGSSFDTIVANGINSSKPHHITERKKVEDGLLLIDFGCIYNNYCSDITRTIIIGKSGQKDKEKRLKEIYDIVLQSQLCAIESCREGISCAELDRISRDFIKKNGYDAYFLHSLGHGVGIEIHEKPTVSLHNNLVLRENMVITIEPAVYLEGIGGIRIEDMVQVKKDGCRVLYTSSKSLLVFS